jgi:hypothetical protein
VPRPPASAQALAGARSAGAPVIEVLLGSERLRSAGERSPEEATLKQKRVRAFLRTPLYRGRNDGGRSGLTLDVVEVVGLVVDETRSGLYLDVEALHDARGKAEPGNPLAEIVLPLGKIDYLVVLDD